MSKSGSFKKESKKRVVLYNTYCGDASFVKALISSPHFYIQKNGIVHQFYDPEVVLNPMVYNDGNIYVAFENKSMLIDIKGKKYDIFNHEYFGPTIECAWKGYRHWDEYTENQYMSLNNLLKIFNIKGSVKQTLEYIPEIVGFSGVCYRANFSDLFYDVTPAFKIQNIYY